MNLRPIEWLALLLTAMFAYSAFRPQEFARRFVPPADARSLAMVRILACVVMLGYVLVSDLPATARLPRELLVPMGVISLLNWLPGFSSFLMSESSLAIFQSATCVLLLAGALGWRARISVPLAALFALVFIGLFWHYTYFFHQGLIGLYALLAVSVTPCADAWSLDSRRGRTTLKSGTVYGWSRYLCWVAVCVPYVLAGLSKLRIGGFGWWRPTNLRSKILGDTLADGLLDWDLGLRLVEAPDALFVGIGLFTLSLELSFIAVLFSHSARQVLPILVVGLHLGILLLQDFVFVDAVLMQSIFLGSWAVAGTAEQGEHERWALRSCAAVFVLVIGWMANAEFYPISSWKMYSGRTTSTSVSYNVEWAEHAARGWIPAPYSECFPAPSFNPYVHVVGRVIDRAYLERGAAFLSACRDELNRDADPSEHILRWRIERRRWDYARDPAEPPYGELISERLIE